MQSQINSINFYNWFMSIGGDLSNSNAEIVSSSANRLPLTHANLKNRAEEIKDKYNHKFKTNDSIQRNRQYHKNLP